MRLILTTAMALSLTACATYTKDKDMTEVSKPMSTACDAQTHAIYFDTGSSDFDTEASAKLNMIADAYKGCDLFRLELTGYADSVGSSPLNLELSEKRAESVLGALSVRGVTADRISIVPMGESDAMMDETPNAWERKVEVRLMP